MDLFCLRIMISFISPLEICQRTLPLLQCLLLITKRILIKITVIPLPRKRTIASNYISYFLIMLMFRWVSVDCECVLPTSSCSTRSSRCFCIVCSCRCDAALRRGKAFKHTTLLPATEKSATSCHAFSDQKRRRQQQHAFFQLLCSSLALSSTRHPCGNTGFGFFQAVE